MNESILPPFFENDVRTWFEICEANFFVHNITDESTKYYQAVTRIPIEVACQFSDILQNSPRNEPYTRLKNVLIRHATSFKDVRNQQPMFDRRHAVQRAPCLKGDAVSERSRNSLPQPTPSSSYSRCSELGRTDSTEALRTEVRQLTSAVQAMHLDLRRVLRTVATGPKSDFVPVDPHKILASRPNTNDPKLCWFHQQHGAVAQQCRPPCKFQQRAEPKPGDVPVPINDLVSTTTSRRCRNDDIRYPTSDASPADAQIKIPDPPI